MSATKPAWWNEGRALFSEVREETIDGTSPLDVSPGGNRGIRIRGWDRGDVLVRARVAAWATTEADASRLVSAVKRGDGGRPDPRYGSASRKRRGLVRELRTRSATRCYADAQYTERWYFVRRLSGDSAVPSAKRRRLARQHWRRSIGPTHERVRAHQNEVDCHTPALRSTRLASRRNLSTPDVA
jgi:hypothetical protein